MAMPESPPAGPRLLCTGVLARPAPDFTGLGSTAGGAGVEAAAGASLSLGMSGVAEPSRGGAATAPPSPMLGTAGAAAVLGTILMGGTTVGAGAAAPSFSEPSASPSFGTAASAESGCVGGGGPSTRGRPLSSEVCSSESRKLPNRGVPTSVPCRGVPSPAGAAAAAAAYMTPSYRRGVAGEPPRGVSIDRGVPPARGVPGGRGVRFAAGATPSAPSIMTRGVTGLTPRVLLAVPAADPSDARASPSLPLLPKRGVPPRGVPKRTSDRGVLAPIGSKRGVPVGVPDRIGPPRSASLEPIRPSAGRLGVDRRGGSRGDAPTKTSRGVNAPAAPEAVRGVPPAVRGVVPRESGELPRGVALRSGSVDAHRISTRGECFNRKGGTGGGSAVGSADAGWASGAPTLGRSVATAALVAASSASRTGRFVSLNENAGRVGAGGGGFAGSRLDASSSDEDEDEASPSSELWWSESGPILQNRLHWVTSNARTPRLPPLPTASSRGRVARRTADPA